MGPLEDCLTTVTYYPVTYNGYIARRDTFTELQEDAANDCNKTFSKVEYEEYSEFLDAHEFPETRDKSELLDSMFARLLTEQMKERKRRVLETTST
jgi:hypothetical protein